MPNGDENYRRDKHSMLGRGSPKTMMNSTQKSYGPGLDAQNVLRKVSLNAAKKAAQGNRFGGSVQRERTGEAFMSDLKKGSYENPTAHNYQIGRKTRLNIFCQIGSNLGHALMPDC